MASDDDFVFGEFLARCRDEFAEAQCHRMAVNGHDCLLKIQLSDSRLKLDCVIKKEAGGELWTADIGQSEMEAHLQAADLEMSAAFFSEKFGCRAKGTHI